MVKSQDGGFAGLFVYLLPHSCHLSTMSVYFWCIKKKNATNLQANKSHLFPSLHKKASPSSDSSSKTDRLFQEMEAQGVLPPAAPGSCMFLPGHRLEWTWARGGRTRSGWHCEVPGAPEQLGRCDSCPGPHGAGCACAHTPVPTSPPSHTSLVFPASSGVVHLRPLAALSPAVLGSCQVKSWLARFDPTCELFYFPLSPLHGFGVLL